MMIRPDARSPIDQAIDSIEQKRLEAEWSDTVRLAEAVFPREWNIRVEPHSGGAYVAVQFTVAHGRNPIDALKKAIDWYRGPGRLTIPQGVKR